MHLPMMALVLLLLTHLAIFLPWSSRRGPASSSRRSPSRCSSEGAGWLVRFVSRRRSRRSRWGRSWGSEVTLLGLLLGLAMYLASADRPGARVRAQAAEMRGEGIRGMTAAQAVDRRKSPAGDPELQTP